MNLSFVDKQMAIEELKNNQWESIRKLLYVVSTDGVKVEAPQYCCDIIIAACKRYIAKYPRRKLHRLCVEGQYGIEVSIDICENLVRVRGYGLPLELSENFKNVEADITWEYNKSEEFLDLSCSFDDFDKHQFQSDKVIYYNAVCLRVIS